MVWRSKSATEGLARNEFGARCVRQAPRSPHAAFLELRAIRISSPRKRVVRVLPHDSPASVRRTLALHGPAFSGAFPMPTASQNVDAPNRAEHRAENRIDSNRVEVSRGEPNRTEHDRARTGLHKAPGSRNAAGRHTKVARSARRAFPGGRIRAETGWSVGCQALGPAQKQLD